MNQFDIQSILESTFVASVELLEEVDSTNSYAMRQLGSSKPALPWLVLARHQSAGRGRGANQWYTADGSLVFSIVVPIDIFRADQICKSSLSVGLAICQAIERFAPLGDLSLKWPNDVFLEEQKVAGILIERPSTNDDRLVIGVGVNVNNRLANSSTMELSSAISMIDCFENDFDLNEVLIECLVRIERCLDAIRRDDSALLDRWRAYCMLTGKTISVSQSGQHVHGICRGIDADGALLVDTASGRQACYGGSVVSWQ